MRIGTTRLRYDFPAPGIRGTTSEASQSHAVTASSDASGRRHDGGAAHWSRPPVVRVVEGALVEKAPNSDTAWSAVRRMTALRGRIIPAPRRTAGRGCALAQRVLSVRENRQSRQPRLAAQSLRVGIWRTAGGRKAGRRGRVPGAFESGPRNTSAVAGYADAHGRDGGPGSESAHDRPRLNRTFAVP